MTLSQKLRSAAKSPESWDLPGLLEDAANFVDATLQTCESLNSGLEALKSTGDVCGNRRPLTRDEMIAETQSRR